MALWCSTQDLGTYGSSPYADEAVKVASTLLWTMSGRKFTGSVTVTERYVCSYTPKRLSRSSHISQGVPYSPVISNGTMYNLPFEGAWSWGCAYETWGLTPHSRLRLRGRPVTQIHTVRTFDDVIVDPSTYVLAEHSVLQGTMGAGWHPCNVEVTYTYGTPPPITGKVAAQTLATELIKLWTDGTCALPERVTSVSRQGVSYTILDSQDLVQEMRTGIYVIDMFLKSVNPDRARLRSKVFTPDMPRARRVAPKTATLAASAYDIYTYQNTSATKVVDLSNTGVGYTLPAGWEFVAVISNWSGSATLTITDAVSHNTLAQTATVTLGYNNVSQIINYDPGTWELLARNTSNTSTTTTVVEGNLSVRLGPLNTPTTTETPTNNRVMICNQGATFSHTLTWRVGGSPVNLSGYTAAMQVRETASSDTVVLSRTSAGSTITLGGAAGTITISAIPAVTAALSPGEYVYDLELTKTSTGEVTRVAEGTFTVTAEVTR